MRTQSLLGKGDSAESWALRSVSGEEYIVQIGFPRDWQSRSRQDHEAPIPVLYVRPTTMSVSITLTGS